MPLPSDDLRRVEQVASARAYEALRIAAPSVRTPDIHPTPSEGIRPGAKTFAEKIVLLEHNDDWGKPAFWSRDFAEKQPLFYLLQIRDVLGGGGRLRGYPSWLYFGKVGGTYGAVIDESAVRSRFLRAEEAQVYRLYLFFHELGHMLLHRNDLWERKTREDSVWAQAGVATTRMELEADVAAKTFAYKCGLAFPEEYYFREQEV